MRTYKGDIWIETPKISVGVLEISDETPTLGVYII
jgi:hypothetical protein